MNNEVKMQNLKKAIENAKKYALMIFDDKELRNFEVDEIKSSKEDKYWIITLGWDILKKKPPAKTPMQVQLYSWQSDEYNDRSSKVFLVYKKNNNVEMMITKDSDEYLELLPEFD